MRAGTLAVVAGAMLALRLPALPTAACAAGLVLCVATCLAVPRLRVPGAFLGGLLWTALSAALIVADRIPAPLEGRDLVVEGRVAGVPERADRRSRFALDIESAGPADAGTVDAAALRGKRVVRCSAGMHHTTAMLDNGDTYSWGYARLGL